MGDGLGDGFGAVTVAVTSIRCVSLSTLPNVADSAAAAAAAATNVEVCLLLFLNAGCVCALAVPRSRRGGGEDRVGRRDTTKGRGHNGTVEAIKILVMLPFDDSTY